MRTQRKGQHPDYWLLSLSLYRLHTFLPPSSLLLLFHFYRRRIHRERYPLLSPKTGEDHLTQALLQQNPASVFLEDSAEYRFRRTKRISLNHFPLLSPHY